MKSTLFILLSILLISNNTQSVYGQRKSSTKKIADIRIRDPFILADEKTKTYYMYISASTTISEKTRGGVAVYKSKDLETWEGPFQVFTIPEDNAITGAVWAPEVHSYNGRYYLFATLNSSDIWKKTEKDWPPYFYRSTQIFHADSPEGPFLPFERFPHTPMWQMALDGTLWVENNIPYMIYCHEWVEIVDGTMELIELSHDLSYTIGTPSTLFCSSSADWSTGNNHNPPHPSKSYVTDGCFLYKTKTGKLLMIWSSFMNGEYAIGIAESVTGLVKGPWRQQPKPLFYKNGGHGMIFESFDGRLCLTLHQPNSPGGTERAHLFELEDTGESLRVKREITNH